MDIHKKVIVDHERELPIEAQERFCQEYVRLDVEDFIGNKTARRVSAYRFSYPESTISETDSVCNARAVNLMKKAVIKNRIAFLYEQEGSSVESEYAWTKSKSENILVNIAYSGEEKTADRIKAVSELNKMRGIDAPIVKEEEVKGDSVDSFFDKFKGLIHG